MGHTKRADERAIAVEVLAGPEAEGQVRAGGVVDLAKQRELRGRGLRAWRKGCRQLGSGRRWRRLVQLGGEILVDLQSMDLPELLGQAYVVQPIGRHATRRGLPTVQWRSSGTPDGWPAARRRHLGGW